MTETYCPITLGAGLRAAANRGLHRIALSHGDRRRRYGELVERMARLANAARSEYGIEAGDRIALIAPNGLDYVEIVVGLADLGAMTATINTRLSTAEIAAIIADADAKLVILHPDLAEHEAAADGRPLLWLGEAYEALLARAAPHIDLPFVAETEPFALSYTSGTTGKPKGVLLPHRSRGLAAAAMAAEFGCFGEEDRFLALTPFAHGAGFAFALAPLWFGGTVEILDTSRPDAILTRLGEGDVTGVFMVPTHFARIFDMAPAQLDRHRARGHGLKAIISNAAALPQAMKKAAIAQFGDGLLHETYGSTEAGVVTNIRPRHLITKPGSVGTPFASMAIELRDPDGKAVGDDMPGELFARGPTAFAGYWRQPEATAAAVKDGWVTAGDVAIRDGDGFFRIVDRVKDMVVTGGLNVYPKEIEALLDAHPEVRESAVVGRPDREWGEALHAFIVPAEGAAPDVAALLAGLDGRLARHKVPREGSLIDALPRNATGKVLKRELRDGLTG